MNASPNLKRGRGVVDLRNLPSTGRPRPTRPLIAKSPQPLKTSAPASFAVRFGSTESRRESRRADFLSSGPGATWARPKKKASRFDRPPGLVEAGKARRAKKSGAWLLLLIVLLLILAGASLAGFFVFNKGAGGKSLKLALAATEAVASGEEVTLEISYANLDKVPLIGLQAVVEYPEGFYFNSSSVKPANKEENIWDLPELGVNAKESLMIYGQLFGTADSEKEFTVVFRYNPANFNSDFRETLSQKVNIKDSLLKVELSAPEKIEDGQTVEFKGNLENKSEVDYADLRWSFELGEAFSSLNLTPTTTVKYRWSLPVLAVQEKKDLAVSGKINSDKANPLPWDFKVWQTVKHNDQDQERVIFQQSGSIEILAPQLQVNLELVNPEQKINWGEPIDLKITYANLGKLEAKQAVLKLAFNQFIDWAKFQNSANAVRDGTTLVWLSTSGEATAKLANLAPGDKGELTVSVLLAPEPVDLAELSAKELLVNAIASAQIKYNGADKVFASARMELPISSAARLQTEARYYLDAATKVGSGPLPPQIGQETKYRVYWKMFTGSKGLTNVRVKTSLPSYINFAGQVDKPTLGSELNFDLTSRELTWEINDVSPNTGLMASFDLSVTPAENQVNQLLILSNPTSLNALEKQTSAIVAKTTNLLTSDLIGDPMAKGKGRVTVK